MVASCTTCCAGWRRRPDATETSPALCVGEVEMRSVGGDGAARNPRPVWPIQDAWWYWRRLSPVVGFQGKVVAERQTAHASPLTHAVGRYSASTSTTCAMNEELSPPRPR